jgi:histidinol phosphatase-like enzyme
MARTKIAILDFDGTIVEHRYPDIGEPLPEAFEVIKELREAGWKLILWTCREDMKRHYLTEAIEFCREHDIEFDAVNETIFDDDFRAGSCDKKQMRKPYGHVHIDDANLGGFPGWAKVRQLLLL